MRSTRVLEGSHSAVSHGRKIAVIGLGYVGLPVAVAFARAGVPVVGFDIDRKRVAELSAGHDRTREVEAAELTQPTLRYDSDPDPSPTSDFYIVTVPTPIDTRAPTRPRRHARRLRHPRRRAQARRHRGL